jgi:hypothetical protein
MLLADLVSDTPTHNAANYGVPAYPHYSTCSGNPVENDELWIIQTTGVYVFKRAKIKNGYFSFRWSESIIRNIIFLIKYIRKTRYLLASFFVCIRSIKKANALLIIYFALTNAPAFPPNDCNLVHLSQYKFLVVW